MTCIEVGVPGRPPSRYEVRIEAGSLGRLGEVAAAQVPAHRYAVISDSRVGELYGGAALEALREAGARAELFTFPAGEWNKTREEWRRLTDALLHAGYGRDSAVVALGGGVTGDLAGFVAATFMRGVPVLQVPTTLLAMVDSSVGGKTGVDTEAGKNLIGAFHHPRGVLVDPDLLASLPAPQLVAGLAEVVKIAGVFDGEFFRWLEERADELRGRNTEALAATIERSVRWKAEVVAEDPEERGPRVLLNFGHTVGHALELLGGFAVLHGEAVAAGMRTEARLGEELGITESGTADRLASLLAALGLGEPIERDHRPFEILEAASRDKKGREGSLRWVLLRRVGEAARAESGAYTHDLGTEVGTLLEAVLRSPGGV